MNFEMRMCSSGRFVFLVWHSVEAFVLPPHRVVSSTSSAQRGVLHMRAVNYCPSSGLLSSLVISQSSWKIK